MAKVRIYELAKELSTDSKELVEKLIAGGLNIKNYMSTLDEADVAKAKEIIAGVVSHVIEEKRIKSTVIRRRKKIVRVEKQPPESMPKDKVEPEPGEIEEPSDDAQLSAEEKTTDKEEGTAQITTVEKDVSTDQLKESFEVTEKVSKGETFEKIDEKKEHKKKDGKGKAKPKKIKKKKEDRPAKIIKRPEEGPLGDLLAEKPKKRVVEKPSPSKKETFKPAEAIKKIVEDPNKSKSPKKKREKQKETIKESKPKSSFRRRKKEIYERADLFETKGKIRGGKKTSKRGKDVAKKGKQTEITTPKAIKRRIKVQEFVTVAELAKAMGIKSTDLVKKLMGLGAMSNINQPIDFETASVVADEFSYELELDTFKEDRLIAETEDNPEDLSPRPPVVTIMGHVDHGKTSLLDYIRKTNVIDAESGGITQHIGAYYVNTDGGDIVFLDTPGHEAFTSMRARGAKITDIVVLVVAADDGVMPQTKEAVNHARAASIPIVIAVNKIDKPQANPEKVKRELAELDLAPEEWGGDTIFGNVSAKTGDGVDELLNLILLQAEILELKGNPKKDARGSIVEAKLDKNKGSLATVLIKNGTLNKGDYFICGEYYGRVRAMNNHLGKKMNSAGPSVPVEIHGISGVPMAGDEFVVVQDEKTAKQVIAYRKEKSHKQETTKKGLVSLDDLFERIKEGEVKELNIILKTDVQGSLEALSDSLNKLSTEEVKIKTIHSATGAISETDVMLASTSGAIIIGFNVRANPRVTEIAEKEKVDIRYYDVIYKVTKDIKLAMVGLLEPVYEEHVIGRADIKEIFHAPKIGTIAGCQVTDGRIERNSKTRLLRDDVVIYDGKIVSLRRFKDDVKEVQTGYECGISLENYQDIKPGDVFEVYTVEEIEAQL